MQSDLLDVVPLEDGAASLPGFLCWRGFEGCNDGLVIGGTVSRWC